ncbi:MAG: galactokinase [Polyangia bacterium]|jgi:galactokinase
MQHLGLGLTDHVEFHVPVLASFRQQFGEPAVVVRSPGRVNLIGEHTDYNHGFVLPAAVDRGIALAVKARSDRRYVLHALDLGRRLEGDLGQLAPHPERWPNYLLGVLDQLQRAGHPLGGFELVYGGDLPIGAGMSSSAALECGFAFSLNELFGLGLDRLTMAKLSQAAEHNFVGVKCGIMDQMASLMSQKDHVMMLDCQNFTCRFVPFHRSVKIFLCDTQVERALADSGYNQRRSQCEAGVALLQEHAPNVQSLRDVSLDLLDAHRADFDPVVYRRCRYVIEENLRVIAGCEALEREDLPAFGRLMNASHQGLSKHYEVSCPELDVLAEAAAALPGVLGARMMGAGFGGCTINLVQAGQGRAFVEGMAPAFAKIGKTPKIHACAPHGGTERL